MDNSDDRNVGYIYLNPNLTLREVEKIVILHKLAELNQNRTRTAKALGISIRTLTNKLKLYGQTKSERA